MDSSNVTPTLLFSIHKLKSFARVDFYCKGMMARQYKAYLLRLWRNHECQRWRATLLDAQTHEQSHFADLKQLVEFLQPVAPMKAKTKDKEL